MALALLGLVGMWDRFYLPKTLRAVKESGLGWDVLAAGNSYFHIRLGLEVLAIIATVSATAVAALVTLVDLKRRRASGE